jgi:glycerol kinase
LVIDQSAESMQPMPDWQLLGQMAKLNASAGGTLVAPEQSDEIVRQILDRRKQSTQTAVENRRLGDGTLDTWTAFVLLAMIMICQWLLRKKWNLP